jgi:hypothetical protein
MASLSPGDEGVTFTLDVEPVAKHELEATLAAREELGPRHDDELVAGFLERIDREIDRRVDERVAKRVPAKRRSSPLHPGNLAICIPIIAVAGGVGGGFPGVVIAVLALAVIFLYAESHR